MNRWVKDRARNGKYYYRRLHFDVALAFMFDLLYLNQIDSNNTMANLEKFSFDNLKHLFLVSFIWLRFLRHTYLLKAMKSCSLRKNHLGFGVAARVMAIPGASHHLSSNKSSRIQDWSGFKGLTYKLCRNWVVYTLVLEKSGGKTTALYWFGHF